MIENGSKTPLQYKILFEYIGHYQYSSYFYCSDGFTLRQIVYANNFNPADVSSVNY